jgi:membrane protein implicated in regulation of membrane protease activity
MAGQKAGMEEDAEEPDVRPMVMRAAALSVTADFLLLVGVLFVLVGVAAFLTDFLKIAGSGEFLIGVFIIALAVLLLLRSGQLMPRMPRRAPRQQQQPIEKSESYR